MNLFFNQWTIIPCVIPTVLLLIAYLFKKNLPKNINSFYGYRTPFSMKNNDTWLEANHYSASIFIKTSTATVFTFFIGMVCFQNVLKAQFDENLFFNCSTFVSIIIILVPVIVSTEKHLRKHFDKNGVRKL